MTAYYNEIDPFAASWLRELIAKGHIAQGVVDERDIRDISPDEFAQYTQCHFFAGIGGWSLALRLAGWPDDRPVWTGSCPCQPFSAAGRTAGFADERHLWPHWHHLIRQRKPSVVFGEQVASKDGLAWLDLVSADMEGEGYAIGAMDLCAAGFGAPHIRQRLWFVGLANAATQRRQYEPQIAGGDGALVGEAECRVGVGGDRNVGGLANAGCPQRKRERISCGVYPQHDTTWSFGAFGDVGPTDGHWRDADWLFCRDGKWRPVEPGTSPLAHGVPARVGRLRGYGNAIVPQVAAEVIKTTMNYLDHS